MPLFDGLTLGELVLLIGGALFFVALLAVFLRKSFTNKSVKGLLAFFAVPIVMMGFPTISSFKISQEGVEIDNQTTALQNNPNDEASRKALETNVVELKKRSFSNPQTLAKLARAEYALGQEQEAKNDVAQALKSDPSLQPAVELKTKIELADKISALNAAAESPAATPEVKQQLGTAVAQASQYKFANPKALQSLQKATKILKPEQVAQAPKN
ncbi:MAG TPA: hypothetical protein VMH04_14840 [Candidatus Solibacter sp.]|nr:hypothetical protein [Candidatus Solibacter sp.]